MAEENKEIKECLEKDKDISYLLRRICDEMGVKQSDADIVGIIKDSLKAYETDLNIMNTSDYPLTQKTPILPPKKVKLVFGYSKDDEATQILLRIGSKLGIHREADEVVRVVVSRAIGLIDIACGPETKALVQYTTTGEKYHIEKHEIVF